MTFKITFVLLLTISAIFATSEKELTETIPLDGNTRELKAIFILKLAGKSPQSDNPYYQHQGFDYGNPALQGHPPYYGPPMFNPFARNPYFGSPMGNPNGGPYGGSFGPGVGMFGNSGNFFGPPPGKVFGPPPGKIFGPPPGTAFGPPPGTVFGPPPGKIPPGKVFGPPPGTVFGPPPGTLFGPPPGTVFGPPPGTYMGPYGKFPFWNGGFSAFHPTAIDGEMY